LATLTRTEAKANRPAVLNAAWEERQHGAPGNQAKLSRRNRACCAPAGVRSTADYATRNEAIADQRN
jgi:hypothetical protein